MNKHIENRLQAYFDGELAGKRKKYVEYHLNKCKECTQLLDNLGNLSELLSIETETSESLNIRQFVSQVMLRLPRKNIDPALKKARIFVFSAIPALLFFALVFIRTAAFSSNLLVGVDFFGLGGEEASSLLADSLFNEIAIPIELPVIEGFDIGNTLLSSLGNIDFFGFDLANSIIYPLLFGLLAISWMIGWWVAQDNK